MEGHICGTVKQHDERYLLIFHNKKEKMLLSTSHNGYTDLAWSVEVINKRALVLLVDDCQKPSCLGET